MDVDLFFIFLSGGECYEYKWFSSVNSTRPFVWCQRSDGLNVTGKKLTSLTLQQRLANFFTSRSASEDITGLQDSLWLHTVHTGGRFSLNKNIVYC